MHLFQHKNFLSWLISIPLNYTRYHQKWFPNKQRLTLVRTFIWERRMRKMMGTRWCLAYNERVRNWKEPSKIPNSVHYFLYHSFLVELFYKTKRLIFFAGTIGHVAHGKSTVVKSISGVQTVRFKNEIERNITIKLGYANAKVCLSRRRRENIDPIVPFLQYLDF